MRRSGRGSSGGYATPVGATPSLLRRRMGLLAAVGALVLLVVASDRVESQVVSGLVRDAESGEPIQGVTVMVADAQDSVRAVALTDEQGSYRIRSVAGDTIRVRAQRLGFRPMESQLLVLEAASELVLAIELTAVPVALQPITVTAERQSRNRQNFERRKRSELWGRFVGMDRLSRVRSPRAVDRLRRAIPGMVVGAEGIVRVLKRGADMTGVASCQPRFVIDGVRFPGDIPLDGLVSGEAIRAVEYYSEPLWAPAEFAIGHDPMLVTRVDGTGAPETAYGLGRPCAIVVIWTEMGFGSD